MPFGRCDKSKRLGLCSLITFLPIISYNSTSISNLVSIVIISFVGLGIKPLFLMMKYLLLRLATLVDSNHTWIDTQRPNL